MSKLLCTVLLFVLVLPARAQDSLDVTFRFLPDLTPPVHSVSRVFVPGSFNDWGPNASGRIAVNAPSLAAYNPAQGEWTYTKRLRVGSTYQYKIHLHKNADGSSNEWLTDPINPRSNPADNNNSLVTVADPMVFQLAREQEGTDAIVAVSASLFSQAAITGLTFEVNGVERDGLPFFASGDGASGLFRYELPSPVAPGSFFKLTATDDRGRVVSDSIGVIPPQVVDAPRPAGLQDGITYGVSSSGEVKLSLFAPYHQYAYVLGDFNDWKVDPAYLMKRDSVNADSVYFWLEIDGLTPGVEYGFQYFVDGLIRVADPYSEKILDPYNDDAISYSGFRRYPTGKTTEMVGVLYPPDDDYLIVTGCDPHTYERPPQGELVIYELLLRDFVGKHDFDTLADTLGYLKKLGVNAIELMPVSEFEGNESWGYNPMFYFALDKYYGSRESFKRFVAEAHCQGIAVILDVVYNHATGQSPLIRLWNTSATGSPGAGPSAINPYANTSARHPFNVFNDLNHESPALRYLVDRANRYWMEEYGVDGYRFDLSKGFTQRNNPNDVGAWGQYDASRVATLTRMADALWAYDSTAYVILEHFADNQEEQALAQYGVDRGFPGMMLWTNLNHPFNEATMGYNGGSNFSAAYYGAGGRGFSVPNSVAYMESHDEQWLMYKNRSYAACTNAPAGGSTCNTNPGEYNARDLATALDREKAAGAFFLLLPGPKMLWQFGELGYGGGPGECLVNGDYPGECPNGTPGRVANKPIRWEYRADPDRYRLYRAWAALLGLRAEHPIFRSTETEVGLSLAGDLKRVVFEHPDFDAVLVGNFGLTRDDMPGAFTKTGTWYDYFENRTVEVTDVNQPLDLKPGQFRLLTSAFIGYGDGSLVVDVEDVEMPAVPMVLSLGGVRPNPVRGDGAVTLALPKAGDVRLDLFDALGRRVAVLAEGEYPAGTETVAFDVSGLSAGLYVLRLTASGEVRTQPLIVLSQN